MIGVANNLLSKFGLDANITAIDQCDDTYFVKMYTVMLSESLPGIIVHPVENEEKIHNIQVIIDSLATDILDIDLSHISAQSVVDGDQIHIQNLLEIFDGLLDFVMEEIEDERLNDSNALPDDHEVLSDVFREEFGQSYSDLKLNEPGNIVIDQTDRYPEKPLSPSQKNSQQAEFRFEKPQNEDDTQRSVNMSKWLSGGDSTNELINEAELIEKEQELHQQLKMNTNIKNREKSLRPSKTLQKSNADKYESMKEKVSMNNWSSILSHTSSAVDSLADINQIGKRPRRQFEMERKKEEQKQHHNPNNSKREIQRHQHMHHHFYHSPSTNSLTSSPSMSASSSSSSLSQINEKHPTTRKPLVQTSTASTSMSRGTKDECVKSTATEKGVGVTSTTIEIQTDRPLKVDSSVQTESTKRTGREKKSLKKYDVSQLTLIDTRSKQLCELDDKLTNLRSQIKELPSAFTVEKESRLQNSTRLNDEFNERKRRKDQSKVSFASRDVYLSRDIPSYSSDTEIDYSPHCGRMRGKALSTSHHRNQVRSDSTSSSASSDEKNDTHEPTSTTTMRFEKPYIKRDERLRQLRSDYRVDEKENIKQLKQIRHDYSEQRHALVERQHDVIKQSNLNQIKNQKKKKCLPRLTVTRIVHDRSPDKDYARRLAEVYGNKVERGRRKETTKNRKRSASASPFGKRRLKARMVINEDEILPTMEQEFPFIYLSPHTAKLMWRKQIRQETALCKAARTLKPSKTQQRIEDAQKRQEALTRIMVKELEHNKRLKEYKERKENEASVNKKLKERRQRSARARRYYENYVVQNKARMLKKKYKEEAIFKNLFEEGLQIQRERVREMKKYANEQKEKNSQKQMNEIESMENFYRGQFGMLAESIAQERHDLQVRQKAQNQALKKMKREMRERMENDVKTIQQQLCHDDDSHTFRQIDADNLRREFQLATYNASRFK